MYKKAIRTKQQILDYVRTHSSVRALNRMVYINRMYKKQLDPVYYGSPNGKYFKGDWEEHFGSIEELNAALPYLEYMCYVREGDFCHVLYVFPTSEDFTSTHPPKEWVACLTKNGVTTEFRPAVGTDYVKLPNGMIVHFA